MFSLEAELGRLNTFKPTSTEELSSYLSGMNHLIQNIVTKEAIDKNLTKLLYVTVKNFEDQNVQVQYTSLSLIDVHILPEINGSFNKPLDDIIMATSMIKLQICLQRWHLRRQYRLAAVLGVPVLWFFLWSSQI